LATILSPLFSPSDEEEVRIHDGSVKITDEEFRKIRLCGGDGRDYFYTKDSAYLYMEGEPS